MGCGRYRRTQGRILFGVLLDHDFSAIESGSSAQPSKGHSKAQTAGVARIIRVGMPMTTSSSISFQA